MVSGTSLDLVTNAREKLRGGGRGCCCFEWRTAGCRAEEVAGLAMYLVSLMMIYPELLGLSVALFGAVGKLDRWTSISPTFEVD